LRGQVLQKLDELDPALVMYDRVVERYPESEQFPRALWAAALLRDSLQQDREAVDQYEKLATAHPEFPEIDAVLYNWAWALVDLGREEESSRLFERLHREHTESAYWADATLRLAQRAFETKDYERSRKLVAEVLDGEPAAQVGENAWYLKGQIAAAEGRWDDARAAFDALLSKYPESALATMAQYGVAEAAFRKDEHEEAAERLERLVREMQGREEPWTAVVHLRLAQTLCHEKKWDEAYPIAARLEEAYPDFAEQYEADYVIGRCLSNRAEFEAAREAYRKVIRSPQGAKTETAAKAQLMIAESYYHQKNYRQALREYLALEILYDYPAWQAAALLQAGKCHEMLGEWKQAVDEYTRLIDQYEKTDYVDEARTRLQAARRQLAAASGP
jgi:TolA-binding protein